ncbi:hypothetical protein [Seonamhaeicola algicola]|nr:hypothetical protein [Seonamhaeicola algicola]
MKTKKYLIALAIFGGMVFLAQAADSFNDNGAETAKVDKRKIKVPTHG